MLGGTLARLRGRPRFAQSAMCSNGLSTVADATTTALWIAVAAYGGQILLSDKFGRGWLDASIPLRVGPSSVPGAGRGVFAGADLPYGTILGGYPGRLLSPLQYEQKRLVVPACSSYCWVLDDQRALDPTDERGVLIEPLPRLALAGLALGEVPTTLALINEPSLGMDVNVATDQQGSALLFQTARDVVSGEELFLDYGPTYDRSGYGRS